MPRPKRDYNVALQQDIAKIDQRIEALLVERERKSRMLAALNSPVRIDVATFVGQKATPAHAPKKRR